MGDGHQHRANDVFLNLGDHCCFFYVYVCQCKFLRVYCKRSVVTNLARRALNCIYDE